ncbi:MAG: aminotransferase class I/II-fold pyridoxal phosphate-dependent enzyme [Hyphomicrobiaceae bacterium]
MAFISWNKTLSNGIGNWRSAEEREPRPRYKTPKFTNHPAYKSLRNWERVGSLMGVESPFFQSIEDASGNFTTIQGSSRLNFAWCDYLGLNQHPSLAEGMKSAIDRFGPCTSASRMVAGETPLHQQLEAEISGFLGVDDALLFVSGHAANVSTIATIVGEGDLIVHDEFVHNSAIMGMRLSRAETIGFSHQDPDELEQILRRERGNYRSALVIVEGLYSTEGDVTNLAPFVEIKRRYGAWLMVDDAHGLGVLGESGRGIAEHCDVDARDVDIWMGTLSKTLASCGGYIAGDTALIHILKHNAPGFVYSVGLLPAMTAAALAALRVIQSEPERIQRLHANGRLFLERARQRGLNTGVSEGYGMLPVISGDVLKTIRLWNRVFERGLNPSLMVYPAVPMKAGRLRFFLTSEHSEQEITNAVDITAEELAKL